MTVLIRNARPGRRADLVVLDGDPLAAIGATRRIRHVLKDGLFVARDGAPATPGG